MSEKTLGQIGEEAYQAENAHPIKWDDLGDRNRHCCEVFAQAVISEFLRRNAEPVAWRFMLEGVWFTGQTKERCERIIKEAAPPYEVEIQPLFAAPQPLPRDENNS